MILGLWEIILVSLITIIGIALGILVYSKNPKKKANKFFTFFTFSLLIWITSAFLSEVPKNLSFSLFLSRLTYLGVLLSATFLFYFSYYFPKEKILKKKIIFVINGIVIIFSFINLFSNLVIKEIAPTLWGFNLIFGKVYWLYIGFCFIVAFSALINFLKSFREVSHIEKLQLSYLFLGLVIFIGTSIIVNVIIRAIVGSDIYYRIGNYSGVFLITLLGTAIIRYHLFEIRVILTELLVGLMGIILLILPFLMPSINLKLLTFFIFVLFLIFARYLLKATHEEERRREEAEKLAIRERTLRKETEKLKEKAERLAKEREKLADKASVLAIREGALRESAEKLAKEWQRLAKAKDQFIVSIQHHLRTPLTSIRGYLDILLGGVFGEIKNKEIKKRLENMKKSSEILYRLIEILIDVTTLRTGKKILKLEEIDPQKLIEDV
ncbi:MAG: histidine kinase N-terminal 7TM domain-containing protein, partial [candidate division WOR-3 bacterium]